MSTRVVREAFDPGQATDPRGKNTRVLTRLLVRGSCAHLGLPGPLPPHLPAERKVSRAKRLVTACPLLADSSMDPPPVCPMDGMKESGHLLISCCMSGTELSSGI